MDKKFFFLVLFLLFFIIVVDKVLAGGIEQSVCFDNYDDNVKSEIFNTNNYYMELDLQMLADFYPDDDDDEEGATACAIKLNYIDKNNGNYFLMDKYQILSDCRLNKPVSYSELHNINEQNYNICNYINKNSYDSGNINNNVENRNIKWNDVKTKIYQVWNSVHHDDNGHSEDVIIAFKNTKNNDKLNIKISENNIESRVINENNEKYLSVYYAFSQDVYTDGYNTVEKTLFDDEFNAIGVIDTNNKNNYLREKDLDKKQDMIDFIKRKLKAKFGSSFYDLIDNNLNI